MAPNPSPVGLLDRITATSLDADYAAAAARRGTTGGQPRSPRVAVLLVLAAFGLLVATAAVQTARQQGEQQESRADLVRQIAAGQQRLASSRHDLDQTRIELGEVTTRSRAADLAQAGAEQRVTRLGVASGTLPVRGSGVRIVVDDAPDATTAAQRVLDMDLQNITNGLWQAGAEAISINGQRLSALTAIRQGGSAITVNYERVSPPYVVLAVGDPDRLPARFAESTTGGFWLNASSQFNLAYDLTREDSLSLPAAPHVRLRHAERVGEQP